MKSSAENEYSDKCKNVWGIYTHLFRYSDAQVISRIGLAVNRVPNKTTKRPKTDSALI